MAGTQPISPGGTTYAVKDEYGRVQPSGSFALGAGGLYSFGIPLIAARNGSDKDGRTYTIVLSATDRVGNVGSCSAVVKVPHDKETGACTYALSAATEKFNAGTNRCSVRVITQAGCPWAASSESLWITIDSGANGSGPESVGFSVAANTGPARTGTLTIAGLTFTVTQAGSGTQGGTQGGQSQQASAAVFRPASGVWYVLPNDGTPAIQQWGLQDDIPVPGDYDGDGKIDFAVWRPSTGTWYVIPSSHPATPIVQQWGLPGDIPATGDFDHDGKTDFAVWRPSNGTWYIMLSNSPGTPMVQQWGLPDDVPVAGDYDGDGKTDVAVWRPSSGTWYIMPSGSPDTPIVQQWGLPGDIPLAGDFDGDDQTDFAVWRPSNGTWYITPSSNPVAPIVQQWGLPGDVPLARDFDEDDKADLTVWRPSTGSWYVIPSGNPGASIEQQWGLAGDIPISRPPQ